MRSSLCVDELAPQQRERGSELDFRCRLAKPWLTDPAMTVYVTGTHDYLPVAADERPGLSRFRDKFLNGRGERVMSLGRESGPVRCWKSK